MQHCLDIYLLPGGERLCSHRETHVLQLPRGASCQQQAAQLPKDEQSHKESMIVLSHAVAHHLHCERWAGNINHTAGEQTKESQSSQHGNDTPMKFSVGCMQVTWTHRTVMVKPLLHRNDFLNWHPKHGNSGPLKRGNTLMILRNMT